MVKTVTLQYSQILQAGRLIATAKNLAHSRSEKSGSQPLRKTRPVKVHIAAAKTISLLIRLKLMFVRDSIDPSTLGDGMGCHFSSQIFDFLFCEILNSCCTRGGFWAYLIFSLPHRGVRGGPPPLDIPPGPYFVGGARRKTALRKTKMIKNNNIIIILYT